MYEGTTELDRPEGAARRRWFLGVAGALASAVILTGCQGVAAPAADDLEVVADAQPELVDEDGLVAQHEFLLPAPDAGIVPHLDAPVDERAVVIPGPDGVDARVVWTGLPCQTAPAVEVARDGGSMLITVARGPAVADVCDSSEDFYAIDLVFHDHVGEVAVDARVR